MAFGIASRAAPTLAFVASARLSTVTSHLTAGVPGALRASEFARSNTGRRVVFFCIGSLLVFVVVARFVSSQPSDQAVWLFALWLSWAIGVVWIFGRRSFSPPAFGLMAIMLIFIVVPATQAVAAATTVFAGVDYSKGTLVALQISVAAQVGLTLGVIVIHSVQRGGSAFRRVVIVGSHRRVNRAGIAIVCVAAIALALLTVTSGADLTQYIAIFGGSTYGSFTRSALDTPSGYLGSLVGISGVCIMVALVARYNGNDRVRPVLLFALALFATGTLIGGGGRGRFVVSVLAAGLLWLKIRRSPRQLPVRTLTVLGTCALLVFTAFIGLARGPDHPQITPSNLVSEQFGAGSNQFAPLAGLAQTIPAQQDYLFGSSYLEALYFPIPRAVWPDKPQGAIVMVIGEFSDPANGELFWSMARCTPISACWGYCWGACFSLRCWS